MASVPESDSSSLSAVLSDVSGELDPIGLRSDADVVGLLNSIFRSVGGPGNSTRCLAAMKALNH